MSENGNGRNSKEEKRAYSARRKGKRKERRQGSLSKSQGRLREKKTMLWLENGKVGEELGLELI